MATTKPHTDDPGGVTKSPDPGGVRHAVRTAGPGGPRVRAAPAGESCADCQFYLGDVDETNGTGQCHKSPPAGLTAGWPVVLATDWCGEYQAAV